MAIQIPAPPASVNQKEPHLTPQVLVSIQLEDIVRFTLSTIGQATEQIQYNRVAHLEIQLMYFQQQFLDSALDKAFANIQNSIDNNLNPEATTGTVRVPLNASKIGLPEMHFAVQANNSGSAVIPGIKTTSVYIQIKNLKIELVEQTFAQMKQYITSSVADQ